MSLICDKPVVYHTSKNLLGVWPVDMREAIANRIRQLCREHGITPNKLATLSAVSQSTVKSILNGESRNPGAVTIKKLCDGLDITIGEFFGTPEFDALEQEIQ